MLFFWWWWWLVGWIHLHLTLKESWCKVDWWLAGSFDCWLWRFSIKKNHIFFTFKTNKHTVNEIKCQLARTNNSFEYSYRVSSTVMFCTAGGDLQMLSLHTLPSTTANMVASWLVHAFRSYSKTPEDRYWWIRISLYSCLEGGKDHICHHPCGQHTILVRSRGSVELMGFAVYNSQSQQEEVSWESTKLKKK